MAGARHQLLDIEVARAEGGLRFRGGALEGLGELRGVANRPHAAAAAAGHRLQHDGAALAQAGQEVLRLRQGDRPADPGEQGDAARLRQGPRRGLVAEDAEAVGPWAHEGEPGRLAGLCKRGVLAQEAIARVDRVAARRLRRRDHALDVEIGGDAGATEVHGLVRGPDVQRGGVILGMDRDGPDPEVGGGPGDPDGDLAAIGDQEALGHRVSFPTCGPSWAASRAGIAPIGPEDASPGLAWAPALV